MTKEFVETKIHFTSPFLGKLSVFLSLVSGKENDGEILQKCWLTKKKTQNNQNPLFKDNFNQTKLFQWKIEKLFVNPLYKVSFFPFSV